MNQHRTVEKAMISAEKQLNVSLDEKDWSVLATTMMGVFAAGYESKVEPRTNPNKRPVRQFTRDGQRINDFKSIAQAAAYNGIKRKGILECLKGRAPTYKNYIWIYLDEE